MNLNALKAEDVLTTAAVRSAEIPMGEVCEGNIQVAVTKRAHDYHVCIGGVNGNRSKWACGKTLDEALDQLKMTWPEEF